MLKDFLNSVISEEGVLLATRRYIFSIWKRWKEHTGIQE